MAAAGPSSVETAGGGRPLPPLARASRVRVPRSGVRREGLTPYLFLAPYLLLFLVFILLPEMYGL